MLRYLLPVAIILAAAGQIVLLGTRPDGPSLYSRLALAGTLLLLGAIAFGLSNSRGPRLDAWPDRQGGAPNEDTAGLYPQWPPVLMVSLAAAGAAIGIFSVAGESPAVVALWLVGIVLLLVAQVKEIKRARPHVSRIQWAYLVGVTTLLAIAVATRAWHLTTLPFNVDGDFAAVGLEARDIATGQQGQVFAFGWASIPVLGYLPEWLSMLVFGTGLLGLNAAGVIQGTLMVLGVYLIGHELFNSRVGLLAAALMVASYAHMAISRQASYVDPVFAMTWAAYLLLFGLRTARGWAVVLSRILTALCVQVYYSGRIIIPILGLALLYLLIFRRAWLFARWKAIVIYALAVVVALGPMVLLFLRHPEATMSRTQEVYILSPAVLGHMRGVYGVDSAGAVLLQQAIRTVFAFNYFADKGTQFAMLRPLLDPFTAVLFVLGLGYLLFAVRRASSWFLLWWIVLVLVVGSLLTGNAPYWPRLVILLPAVMIASAVALDIVFQWVRDRLAGRGAFIVAVIMALALVAVGVRNWNAYIHDKGAFATGRTRIARYLLDQPASARAYLVSNGYTYRDREFEFLIPGRLVGALTPEQAEQPIAPAGSPTLLIITTDQQALAQRLAAKYPGGPVGGNTPAEVAFYVFRLP